MSWRARFRIREPELVLAILALAILLLVALASVRAAAQRDAVARTEHVRRCEERFASDLTAQDSLRTVVRHKCVPGGAR